MQIEEQKESVGDHDSSDLAEMVVNETDARRHRQKKVAAVAVILSIFALASVWLLWPSKSANETAAGATNVVGSVRVAKAERQPIAAEVSALGTIFPREQATVAPKINAQIRQMRLLKNAFLRAGDVIAVLESRDIQAQRAEAVAALNEARLNARSVRAGTLPQ